jgi:hypothetical protein
VTRVSCERLSARERVEVAQSARGPLRAERLYLLYCHFTKLSDFTYFTVTSLEQFVAEAKASRVASLIEKHGQTGRLVVPRQ